MLRKEWWAQLADKERYQRRCRDMRSKVAKPANCAMMGKNWEKNGLSMGKMAPALKANLHSRIEAPRSHRDVMINDY